MRIEEPDPYMTVEQPMEPASPETRFYLTISASGKLKLDVEIDSKTIGEEDGRFVFALVQEFASYWRERK